jgi:hypothetical protein|uniref:Transmembrane protein n=1 Tax=Phaeodactylum tricornutum TaxID=2850 RepID=A0A8J9TGR5_PHATR
MSGRSPPLGGNLMIASVLAILSYIPFEIVAKISLVFCVWMFVVDPIPPFSRLLAVGTTLVVALLSKAHRHWHKEANRTDNDKTDKHGVRILTGAKEDYVMIEKHETSSSDEKMSSPVDDSADTLHRSLRRTKNKDE